MLPFNHKNNMRIYNHLDQYLHRWSLLTIGRFRARYHAILDNDQTPFLHSHPFFYLSIVLKGGYTERVLVGDELRTVVRKRFSVVFRKPSTYHRIDSVEGDCRTLFLTWYLGGQSQNWDLMRHPEVTAPVGYQDTESGIYRHKGGWRKRQDGKWFVRCDSYSEAQVSTKLSIHQV